VNNPILSALTAFLDKPSNPIPGKMSWSDIKAMFTTPSPHEKEGRDGKRIRTHATQKNHRHIVGAAFKPRRLARVSPAEYRRRHLGKQ
jgi:hypothetical protein